VFFLTSDFFFVLFLVNFGGIQKCHRGWASVKIKETSLQPGTLCSSLVMHELFGVFIYEHIEFEISKYVLVAQ